MTSFLASCFLLSCMEELPYRTTSWPLGPDPCNGPKLTLWNTNANACAGALSRPCPPADILHVFLAQLITPPSLGSIPWTPFLPHPHALSPLFSPHDTFISLGNISCLRSIIIICRCISFTHILPPNALYLKKRKKFNITLHFYILTLYLTILHLNILHTCCKVWFMD